MTRINMMNKNKNKYLMMAVRQLTDKIILNHTNLRHQRSIFFICLKMLNALQN